ncbi:unnamed protein product [Prorocentrum cordatum]|uniref:Uncharacterized protein n=1 Tax=Prorocentrum cordatum TaxID=2364126 RepID=A0ABN9UUS1_9DINO|nr:unnamed protein product [Polarella glacialis]
MFVIVALRHRVRVFLWYGDTCEDALLKYAPWANDAVSVVAKCHAVSCAFRDDGSVRGLDDEALRTNHWVAGFPLDGGGAPAGASLADSMCEETRFFYAQYLSHSVQLVATVTDGDCGIDVMCSMLGWNRSSVNRAALRCDLCAYILEHAGNRAFVAMLRHTGEIDNHLGLYELDAAGAALVAARPTEHRHGDGGAEGALLEVPQQAERHYSEEEVLALRWKCELRTAGRDIIVGMLKRLPDECANAMVREYTTRGDGEAKTQKKLAPTFLLGRDAPLAKKQKAAEYFLAWMEGHKGPLDGKTTSQLQRGSFPKGLFKAFATERPAVAQATGLAVPQGKKSPLFRKKTKAWIEYARVLRIYQRPVQQFLTSAVAERAVVSTVACKLSGAREGWQCRKGTDRAVRDHRRRRSAGAGRHKARAALREQLAEWCSIMRHSVDVKARVKRELHEATEKLKNIRKEQREAEAVVTAMEQMRVYSLEQLGQGNKKGGNKEHQKARFQVSQALRKAAELSPEQTSQWEFFKTEWDSRMAATHGEDWAQLFAEMVQKVVNDLQEGRKDALSQFMHNETRRVLGVSAVAERTGAAECCLPLADDDERDAISLPTHAPTDAFGMPGDLDDIPVDANLFLKPLWDDGTECSAGVWAGKDGKGSSHGGTFGVLTANWGGKWGEPALHAHMQQDLKGSSCQFLVIQEASSDLLDYVGQDPGKGDSEFLGGKGAQRPAAKFIGVRGPEEGDSTMICGRESLVSGMRLLVFHRTKDGTYTHTKKDKQRTKVTKTAVSRIMIACAKMRFWRTRGSGEADIDDRELDELRLAIINLAAWYPWQQQHERFVRADSCGIFRIGPCEGVRMCYGLSAFGLEGPDLPANCSKVMETLREEDGREIGKRPYLITNIPFLGQGSPCTSYQPQVPARRDKCVQWSFTPVFDEASPAAAEVLDGAKNDKGMFPYRVDSTTGSASWSWSGTPTSKQKPVQFEKFDPQREMFKRGAHMPLMIYVGGPADAAGG